MYSRLYGKVLNMSTERFTPSAYLILGLLAREGPSTPYDVVKDLRATLGKLWPFPHTLFYTEATRLTQGGLVTETRESSGRHRRVFTITADGLSALRAWLEQPSDEPTELRDPALLKLFFADFASDEAKQRLADQQVAMHAARLSVYEQEARDVAHDQRQHRRRTIEQWRGAALRMATLHEAAMIEFWTGVAADTRPGGPPPSPSRPLRSRPPIT